MTAARMERRRRLAAKKMVSGAPRSETVSPPTCRRLIWRKNSWLARSEIGLSGWPMGQNRFTRVSLPPMVVSKPRHLNTPFSERWCS